ncbi:MAG: DUF4291 family protein [Prochloraceae cyanobacterium]|nr:DUF4291 family protein [Prochloraceae cyanobacterium]
MENCCSKIPCVLAVGSRSRSASAKSRDRTPRGGKLDRRAIQLGLRGEFLRNYSRDWILSIEDISQFRREQYEIVKSGDWKNLLTPKELVYPVTNSEIIKKLELSIA